MRLTIARLALLTSIGLPLAPSPSARAQAPMTASPPTWYAPPGALPGVVAREPHRIYIHGVPLFGRLGPSALNAPGTPGMPRGRRYYNGRYFGSFNNRFYGPQYGDF
jgi:hypothetical protein